MQPYDFLVMQPLNKLETFSSADFGAKADRIIK